MSQLSVLDAARQQLRQTLRRKRSALSEIQQNLAAERLISPALALIERYHAEKVAFYLPFNGELSPLPLMKLLHQQGKTPYLPVLHPFSPQQLLFLRYDCPADLERNRFGIWQPKLDVRKVLPATALELIFVPLVGCDHQGNRLGMGGGFYDRTLSQLPQVVSVGLAHRCQQVEQLPLAPWDMPLTHLIVVESD